MTKTFLLTIALFFIVVLRNAVAQITCKECSAKYPQEYTVCYNAPGNATDNTCSKNYCETSLRLEKGVTTTLTRGCPQSNSVPDSSKCHVIDETTINCSYTCNTTDCNVHPTLLMKRCTSNCNYPNGGVCNYVSGYCVCNEGWTGGNCSNRITTTQVTSRRRSCVQCTQEIDSNCTQSGRQLPIATECQNNEKYCVVRQGMLLTKERGIVRSLISRGCSSTVYDKCVLSDPTDKALRGIYTSYTCSGTCSSDGCNTGMVSETKLPLHCSQCKNGEPCVKSQCPAGSKYCYATVGYFAGNDSDGNAKKYSTSVQRGCAPHFLRFPGCSETKIPKFDLKAVSCHATCTTTNCNTWGPERLKCVKCTGIYTKDTSVSSVNCFGSFFAESCNLDEEYCYLKTTKATSEHGTSIKVARGCTSIKKEHNCNTTTTGGITIEVCEKTCTTDGCNSGASIKFNVLQAFIIALVTVSRWA